MKVIEDLTKTQAHPALPELMTLLQEVVASGAAMGFLPPVSDAEARAYWEGVLAELDTPKRRLFVARVSGPIVGSAQLELAQRPNGRHRAEVQKVMVHPAARRLGLGRALMLAVETAAREQGRSLLVLDTRAGDVAEQLYRSLGYVEAGRIPHFARSADGSLHTTVIYYRLVELAGPPQ